LRAVTVDKLLPFQFAPIDNGNSVDSEERSKIYIMQSTFQRAKAA